MTATDARRLVALLQKYRRGHTLTVPGDRRGNDVYRNRADAVITDVRYLLEHGALYTGFGLT
jgi:hypothetical protein